MKAGGSVKSHGWALESHLMALERACRAGSGKDWVWGERKVKELPTTHCSEALCWFSLVSFDYL